MTVSLGLSREAVCSKVCSIQSSIPVHMFLVLIRERAHS